jgi:RNA polymerase sigma-70 factor (TIGR02943 family)
MKATVDIRNELNPADWLDKHGNYLYRYALARVRDSAAAEDLLQETLLAAIGAAGRHEGRSSERTWLAGIMKHKVIDYFRRVARMTELQSVDENEPDFFEKSGTWPGHWREDQAPMNWPVDAAKLLESSAFCRMFESCLSRLPRQMSMAFTLREIEGLETNEICEILGISANNLWVLLHRGRARLRQLIESDWFGAGNSAITQEPPAVGPVEIGMPPVSEFSHRIAVA